MIDRSKHRFLHDEAGNRTHAIVSIADFEAMLEALGTSIASIESNETDLLEKTSAEKLTIQFDRDGDILQIKFCQPYVGQGSAEIASGVVARTHPSTGKVESLEIMDLSARDGKLELPMIVEELEFQGVCDAGKSTN